MNSKAESVKVNLRLANPPVIQSLALHIYPSSISQELTGPSVVDTSATYSPIGLDDDTRIPPTPTCHILSFVNEDFNEQGYDEDINSQDAPWKHNQVEDYTNAILTEGDDSDNN